MIHAFATTHIMNQYREEMKDLCTIAKEVTIIVNRDYADLREREMENLLKKKITTMMS